MNRGDRLNKLAANLVLAGIGLVFVLPLLWVLFASVNSTAGLVVEWPNNPSLNKLPGSVEHRHDLPSDAQRVGVVRGHRAAHHPLCRAGGVPAVAVPLPVQPSVPAYGVVLHRVADHRCHGAGLRVVRAAQPDRHGRRDDAVHDHDRAAVRDLADEVVQDGVPISLEEAAWVDGAGNMQALFRIVLPLMWPGVAVVLIFTFVGMWGNFFVPFVLLLSPERLPASVSIFTSFSQYGEVNYGQLAAYSLIYTLPVVLLYLLLSKRLGGAFTLGGAIKG